LPYQRQIEARRQGENDRRASLYVEYRRSAVYHEASAEEIIKWADMAMYQAKNAGRNSIRFYDQKA
jgi:GGDEF domain-containing protein